ncbi:GDSL Lipase/Acylhydrolase family protein [Sodiomyces alkalinus F11]|uniref:GDSL Lipase/Acylhydrolase family protein n=1 Tax=Sodiomyces alkalinus (strain CBS 110278 / VKM F-3762 / F11) TaxID=1314773 RepID=A0A3N2PWC3_SODAK|nr:GDSL Lipase/Acylhydrolase family protein [Sodiomyces alkalinus F11]ROT38787.1 GDSL Lipase/Acylhydrolase family protein [Sodiomyces alkalinus F11]
MQICAGNFWTAIRFAEIQVNSESNWDRIQGWARYVKLYPQIVLLGDSLIQHATDIMEGFSFQAALQAHVARRLDVINRGFSGYNTENVITFLDDLFQPPSETVPKIDYLLILLGANDAVRPFPELTQHVPQEKYKTNLRTIISHPAIRAHGPEILLVTPPPVDEIRCKQSDLAKGWPDVSRFAGLSAAYSRIARDVAAETPGVVSVDLYTALVDYAVARTPGHDAEGPRLGTFELGESGKLGELLPDGVHLSGEAYKVFFEAVVPHVHPEWASEEPDRSGYLFPDWRELYSM